MINLMFLSNVFYVQMYIKQSPISSSMHRCLYFIFAFNKRRKKSQFPYSEKLN